MNEWWLCTKACEWIEWPGVVYRRDVWNPSCGKKIFKDLWCDFSRKHTDDNGCYNGGVSRSDYLEIISTATSSQEKCYYALDQKTSKKDSDLLKTCRLLPLEFTEYEESIKRLRTEVKKHCKSLENECS